MERISIPAPETNRTYIVNTFEELGNLRVIDLLILLTTDCYAIAGRAFGIKFEYFDEKVKKNPSNEREIRAECISWIKQYTHNDNQLWLILERNYGQTVKFFFIDLVKMIELAEKNPSFFEGVSKKNTVSLKRLVYSDFFQSIKNEEIPTKWHIVKLTPLLSGLLSSFEMEASIYPKLALNFSKLYVAYSTKNISQILNILRPIITNIFGQYAFEIHTHYILNWVNQEKAFERVFPNFNDELLKSEELVVAIERNEIANSNSSDPIDSMTESQRVLMIHFFLKFLNPNYKNGVDTTVLTSFILMITGKRVKVVKNLDIYKKLRTAPNFLSEKKLEKDLIVVRYFFENIGFQEILQSIDNEIDRCNLAIGESC
jgi:hypothetical protein